MKTLVRLQHQNQLLKLFHILKLSKGKNHGQRYYYV